MEDLRAELKALNVNDPAENEIREHGLNQLSYWIQREKILRKNRIDTFRKQIGMAARKQK